jgi:hypothetical protein
MCTQCSAKIFLYDQHIHIFPSYCVNTFKLTVTVQDGGTNTHEDGTSLDVIISSTFLTSEQFSWSSTEYASRWPYTYSLFCQKLTIQLVLRITVFCSRIFYYYWANKCIALATYSLLKRISSPKVWVLRPSEFYTHWMFLHQNLKTVSHLLNLFPTYDNITFLFHKLYLLRLFPPWIRDTGKLLCGSV